MLVRHKFSIRAETLRYGVSLKKAYMPIRVPMGVAAWKRNRQSDVRTER